MSFFIFSCQNEQHEDYDELRPNVLLILVDDMGYSDIGCYGGEIPTPNIDRLANNGLRMTQFYNAARCCPSRASLLTGLYPHQAGMGHQNQDKDHPAYRGKINNNATTIAEVLKNDGYATYQVGKWHVGSERDYWPDRKGFEQYFTLIEGAMNYYNQWPWVKNQDSLRLVYNGKNYNTTENFYATATFADSASAFIRHRDPTKPFFMYLAFNAPHWPLHAPQEDIDKYRGKYLKGWDSVRIKRLSKMKALGLIDQQARLSRRFHSVPEWNTLSEMEKQDWDLKMALYAAVIENLDRSIGQVMDALEITDQLEKTMIIFLSDNGACYEDPVPKNAPWAIHPTYGLPGSAYSFPSYGTPWANVSNTPYSYFKSYLHEGGIATPLIVYHPGTVPKGQINRTTIGHVMDLMPTILDLADVDYPQEINERTITPTPGISLLPAFRGEQIQGHEILFWEHQFNRAVRKNQWKLVSPYKILNQRGVYNQWELYNLEKDPTEMYNVIDEQPELATSLIEMYERWAKEIGVLTHNEMNNLRR